MVRTMVLKVAFGSLPTLLVVGHFGEVNKGFKQLSNTPENLTPTSSTDHKRKGAYALFKKRFKVALRCMIIRTQSALMMICYVLRACARC